MPRFILHRQKHPNEIEATSPKADVPDGLRSDSRITIIDEMPRLLLVECPEDAVTEWLARMPGWKLQPEQRAGIPDPKPKLKKRPG